MYNNVFKGEVALFKESDLLDVFTILANRYPFVSWVNGHHCNFVSIHSVNKPDVLNLSWLQCISKKLIRVIDVLVDLDLLIRHLAESLDFLTALPNSEADFSLLDGEDDAPI